MRKAEPFRNRQVTGSIPVVGSTKYRAVNKMPTRPGGHFLGCGDFVGLSLNPPVIPLIDGVANGVHFRMLVDAGCL
jgi:hypothetical protein